MKKIQKYLSDKKVENLTGRLASYAAVAGVFMFAGAEVQAQCAAVGAPIPVDIDGDGTIDVNLNVISGALYDPPGSLVASVPYFYNNNVLGSAAILLSENPSASSLYTAGGGACSALLTTPYVVRRNYISSITRGFSYVYTNVNVVGTYLYAFATVPAGNQIIGVTAGASACPATAGSSAAFVNYGYAGSVSVSAFTYTLFQQYVVTSITGNAAATSGGNSCFNSVTATVGFAGRPGTVSGPNFNLLVDSSVSNALAVVSGPNPIGGNTPGNTQLALQFQIGGMTHNGWIQLTPNPDGTACIAATGYNGCSIEAATANGTPDDSCIASGSASLNTDANGMAAGCPVAPACDADVGTFPGRD